MGSGQEGQDHGVANDDDDERDERPDDDVLRAVAERFIDRNDEEDAGDDERDDADEADDGEQEHREPPHLKHDQSGIDIRDGVHDEERDHHEDHAHAVVSEYLRPFVEGRLIALRRDHAETGDHHDEHEDSRSGLDDEVDNAVESVAEVAAGVDREVERVRERHRDRDDAKSEEDEDERLGGGGICAFVVGFDDHSDCIVKNRRTCDSVEGDESLAQDVRFYEDAECAGTRRVGRAVQREAKLWDGEEECPQTGRADEALVAAHKSFHYSIDFVLEQLAARPKITSMKACHNLSLPQSGAVLRHFQLLRSPKRIGWSHSPC